MEQLSLFDELEYWVPWIDNGCRMWRCPGCLKSLAGQPLNWFQFNYYNFCPYCGKRLYTREKDLRKYSEEEMMNI